MQILSSGYKTRDLHMQWLGLTFSGMWSTKLPCEFGRDGCTDSQGGRLCSVCWEVALITQLTLT